MSISILESEEYTFQTTHSPLSFSLYTKKTHIYIVFIFVKNREKSKSKSLNIPMPKGDYQNICVIPILFYLEWSFSLEDIDCKLVLDSSEK